MNAKIVFLMVPFLFTHAAYAQQCVDLFNLSKTNHAAIFRLPHDSRSEEFGQDGITYNHLNGMTWNSSIKNFKAKKLSKMGDAEAIFEFSGKQESADQPVEIYSAQGLSNHKSNLNIPSGNLNIENELTKHLTLFGTSTAVRLTVSSINPGTKLKMYIRKDRSYEVFAATIDVPQTPTDISIPWKDFKPEYKPTFELNNNNSILQKVDHMGFIIDSATADFNVRFAGPITYERDIEKSTALQNFLINFNYSVYNALSDFDGYYGKGQQFVKDGRTAVSDRKLMKLVLKNLFDPTHQKWALDIARKGDAQVLEAIKAAGFTTVAFKNKVTPLEFFGRNGPLNTIAGFPSQYEMTGIHEPRIPIETGKFSAEHGTFSHALQVLAITKDMTPKQLAHFRGIFCGLFGSNERQWAIWDILFDAPGNNSANSPLFWRDQLER